MHVTFSIISIDRLFLLVFNVTGDRSAHYFMFMLNIPYSALKLYVTFSTISINGPLFLFSMYRKQVRTLIILFVTYVLVFKIPYSGPHTIRLALILYLFYLFVIVLYRRAMYRVQVRIQVLTYTYYTCFYCTRCRSAHVPLILVFTVPDTGPHMYLLHLFFPESYSGPRAVHTVPNTIVFSYSGDRSAHF